MIGLAGLLLVIPGFFTDILGLLLFVPPLREAVWRFLKARIVVVEAGPSGFRRDRPRVIELDSDDFSRQRRPDDED
jgi:UPF0716 protein FxsA